MHRSADKLRLHDLRLELLMLRDVEGFLLRWSRDGSLARIKHDVKTIHDPRSVHMNCTAIWIMTA